MKLLAQQPVFKLGLKGARGCVYGIEEINAISQLFATGKGAMKGKSITIEDVNQLLDVVVDEKKVYRAGNALGEKQYTPESFLVKKYTKDKIIHTGYYYRKNSIIGKEKEKKILFLKDGYWLASFGVYVCSIYASFGLGNVYDDVVDKGSSLFYSCGSWNDNKLAVRPVLYLNSNVTPMSFLKESCENDKKSLQKLLSQLEEKRQERQRIYEEEEKIIIQIKELTR